MDAAKRPKYLLDSIKPRRANELGTAGAGESHQPVAEILRRAQSPLSKFPEQILGGNEEKHGGLKPGCGDQGSLTNTRGYCCFCLCPDRAGDPSTHTDAKVTKTLPPHT